MPKLTHFNTYTHFREAMSFLEFSADADDIIVKLETYTSEDGIVQMKMSTDRGVVAISDATIKSEGFENEIYVRLKDLCILCDKGVKENDCALWVDEGRLYIGSCFNEDFNGFESECSLPLLDPVDTGVDFDPSDSITLEQSAVANIGDSCFDFPMVEIWRIDGIVSFRTGDDRVSIATICNSAGGEPQVVDDSKANLSIRIPSSVFKVIGMTTDSATVKIDIDTGRRRIQVGGGSYMITYGYNDGILQSDTSDGLTDYMKFDALAMMATIDMLYGINYLDPIAPVILTPIDETAVSIEIASTDRYAATITMCGVRMYDVGKSVVLPMDIATMMVRKCNCKTLTLKVGDSGRLFMCYQNANFARKCMYFGS